MLTLNLITSLLVLAAPLTSGMPHYLEGTEPVLDTRDGDWKRAGIADAAVLVARTIGVPRVVPLNPKNPYYAQSVTALADSGARTTSRSRRPTTRTTSKTTTTTTTSSTTTTTTATTTTTTSTTQKSVAQESVGSGPSPTTSGVASATTTRAQTVRTATASWYTQNGNAGACGVFNSDSTPIVALDSELYGDSTIRSKYCGRTITVTNPANGNTVVALVQDVCSGCGGKWGISLSTGAFDQLANQDAGIINVLWNFNALGSTLPSTAPGSTQGSASPTTSAAASPSSSPANSPAAPSPTSGSSPTIYTGQGTYFFQGGQAGACGVYNADSVPLVALDSRLYGNMGLQSQYCGRFVTITNTANGKTVVAKVQDACPGCASKYSLDLSTGAFDKIGDRSTGILPISWYFNP